MKVRDVEVAILLAAQVDLDDPKEIHVINLPEVSITGKDKDGMNCEVKLKNLTVRV